MTATTELEQYLYRCSRCGGCQAACPLYRETKVEPYVARGKIFLLRSRHEGKIALTPRLRELLDLCLLCRACTEVCPNSIPVDELVLAAREEGARVLGLPFLKKNTFQYLLRNNGRLSLAVYLGYLYQHSGLQALVRKTRLLDLFGDLGKKERLLPPLARRPFRRQVGRHLPARDRSTLKVAYFTGCLTNYVFPNIGHAVLEVLRRSGAEVFVPEQWCCGIPALASGDRGTLEDLAARNVASFLACGADVVVTDCASCGSTLKKYGKLLGTPEARDFAGKVRDFSELVWKELSFQPGGKPLALRLTYHEPCHLGRLQGVKEAPRALLASLPGVSFREMREADRCCGAAGSFNLSHYELARKVGLRKVAAVAATGAEAVVTSCPSCMMQLKHLLALEGSEVRVLHLAEVLSATYPERGEERGELPVGREERAALR